MYIFHVFQIYPYLFFIAFYNLFAVYFCWYVDMYWVGQKVRVFFSCKIKDMFFIFTNNFIDLDILSMSAVSSTV